jgi:soluble lytic murein transglycosylase
VRLGEALIEAGSPSRGKDLIRQAWAQDTFDPDQELYLLARHGDLLTPDVDRERLEMLFARNELTEARRETARVSPDVQRVASVRFLLRSDPARGMLEANALPPALRGEPGLLFDEARALLQRNDVAQAADLISRAPMRDLAKLSPTRLWSEINLAARAALQSGRFRDAYLLASNASLPDDSSEYSEAEFLAGWIALRELNEPQRALVHFQNLDHWATRPISRARARYWMGRAREAGGDAAAALQDYRLAGEIPETFYGQLALARIQSSPSLHLQATIIDAESSRASFEREELTRAIHVLADLGLEAALREFALQDADTRPEAGHVKLLAEELARIGFREVAVRVAKEASYTGVRLPEYSHPVIVIPRYSGPPIAPEPSLVLAITRQETEFDPDAVSGAGARGIMQLMPASAQRDATLAGLGYSPSGLTRDPAYNMELGMTELAGDLSEWGGSYILAAASYNAGRGNVRKWVAAFGDPRDARIDPIDWIELIPFSETRNYVQRVLENVQVYRCRLAGGDLPLRILGDLYRPGAPVASLLRYSASTGVSGAAVAPQVPRNYSPPATATPADSPPAIAPVFKPSPGNSAKD